MPQPPVQIVTVDTNMGMQDVGTSHLDMDMQDVGASHLDKNNNSSMSGLSSCSSSTDDKWALVIKTVCSCGLT
ncbi:unnamed protein product [Rotaria magnacalcarata]|uniref:Uncharacterized protein n=1 Tax=Rotaria magnacalcarata TaxID=392030 RepID=A0A820ALR1_9BILA|nr:unnamed protein product [Rotaria magnacalcarata]